MSKIISKLNIISRFTKRTVYKFSPSIILDNAKCIGCCNCVKACQAQEVNFLEINNNKKAIPVKDKNKDCIYCGQCILACPTESFLRIGEIERIYHALAVEQVLKLKNKTIIFQFAPSIRASIGEEFGMPYGRDVTGKLVAAIRQLGADKVFDVAIGADFTTVEEAKELANRLKQRKNLPMLTSCCPAWVKFVEFYYPEFIPNLTSVRSPHIISSTLIKNYWADKNAINSKKVIVISIMPCVAKKYEIERKELQIDGVKPVDYVLTTRELAFLLKKNKIDFKNIVGQKPDNPFGAPSGAGVIYGASGGVMESALRTAYEKLTNKKLLKIEFTKVRGMRGIKKAEIKIKNRTFKIAVVNGIGNAKRILEEIKKNKYAYDYIEVMACPGGCIGGGGQPIPTNKEIIEKRAKSLYKIDSKKKIRLAHKNPIIERVYKDFLNSDELTHKFCHTKYFRKKREVY